MVAEPAGAVSLGGRDVRTASLVIFGGRFLVALFSSSANGCRGDVRTVPDVCCRRILDVEIAVRSSSTANVDCLGFQPTMLIAVASICRSVRVMDEISIYSSLSSFF